MAVGHFYDNDLESLFHRSFYSRTGAEAAEAAAAAHVPSGVLVAAASTVGPHLDARDTVVLWDGARANVLTPWVVASVDTPEFSFNSLTAQRGLVARLQQKYHYVTVFSQDGFLVMHAPGAAERDNTPVIVG